MEKINQLAEQLKAEVINQIKQGNYDFEKSLLGIELKVGEKMSITRMKDTGLYIFGYYEPITTDEETEMIVKDCEREFLQQAKEQAEEVIKRINEQLEKL